MKKTAFCALILAFILPILSCNTLITGATAEPTEQNSNATQKPTRTILPAKTTAPWDVSFPPREIGPADAKVVVEIFSDFQCPWCGFFAQGPEAKLRDHYVARGTVRYIYRNLPVVDSFMANGMESHDAAMAALCAGDQGQFWVYHDALFRNQAETENSGNFSRPRLYALAVQLKLDGIAFEKCMGDQAHNNVIDGDSYLATTLGINATPSFLVNGRQVEITTNDFQQLFDTIDSDLLAQG